MDGAPFLQLLFVLVFIQSFSHQLCSQPFNILRKSNLLKAELCIFDLHSLDSVGSLPTDFVVDRTASADMIVDGTCVWFEALFDDQTVLSTSPLATNTSWGNRMYRLDQEFVQGQQLLRKPPQLTWEEAASYGVGCFTSYRMLDRADLGTNETVLIWGAAGGLGCFAIQLARLQGAVPIAVVSNEEKAAVARLLGAEIVVDRTEFPDLAFHPGETSARQARRLAATKAFGRTIQSALAERGIRSDGVDVVFEHTGQETFPASVFLARRMGRIVICGATSGYELTFDVRHLWMRQKSIIGCHGSNAQDSQRANELVCQGKIRPVLSKAYTVDECVLAHEEMRQNLKIGTTACLMVAPRLGLRNLAETLRA